MRSEIVKKRIFISGGSGFIGTNLVEFYLNKGWEVLNVDIDSPQNIKHQEYWVKLDINDKEELSEILDKFQPDFILHFAARTDLSEKASLNNYRSNYLGVRNLIDSTRKLKNLKRIIFSSSQLVCKIGYRPKNEEDYCPSTLYGYSKVIGEEIVKSAGGFCKSWLILRPTSIWGPWFNVPYKEFFETIERGFYFHPGENEIIKKWGFVYNSVYQINKLLLAPNNLVHGKTFYLSDYKPIELGSFANLIQRKLCNKKIKTIPICFMNIFAFVGDFLSLLGLRNIPLTSFRLKNILTNEIQDTQQLQKICGDLPYTLEEAVDSTLGWLNENR